MSGPVFHRGEQRIRLTQYLKDFPGQVYIGPLVVSTYVVDPVRLALMHDEVYGTAVVKYMNPIANVKAIAIDGDRSVTKSIQNDRRNEFLRVLLRAIVITAPRDDYGQPVGVVIGSNQKVGRGLAGRIGGVGAEG